LSASKAAAAPPGASAGEGSGGLHRIIRVRDGLAVSVGMVIGAGILRTPGLIASYLGDPRAILFIWVLGGVIAGLSTLMIAEMAAAMPSAGGKYVYAREAWGPTAGFVAGWAEIIVSRGFSGASKAVVIATYAIELAGRGNLRVVATALVLAFAVLHLGGLKAGTTFQNVSTVIKIIVLAGIAAAGIASGDPANFTASTPPAPEYAGLLGFALAYQAVAFAYYGWEDASKMAEEVRDPGKALPRILLGGAAAVAILYLLINISFIAALRPDEMAGSTLVARDAVAESDRQGPDACDFSAGIGIDAERAGPRPGSPGAEMQCAEGHTPRQGQPGGAEADDSGDRESEQSSEKQMHVRSVRIQTRPSKPLRRTA